MSDDRTDADRYRWLKQTDAFQLACIAWRFEPATHYRDPDAAIDAARGVRSCTCTEPAHPIGAHNPPGFTRRSLCTCGAQWEADEKHTLNCPVRARAVILNAAQRIPALADLLKAESQRLYQTMSESPEDRSGE